MNLDTPDVRRRLARGGIAAAALAAVFVADLWTPLGFAHGLLYVPVVLLAMLSRSTAFVLWVAGASGLLTLLGAWLVPPPPSGLGTGLALANRGVSLAVIGLTAGIAAQLLRTAQRLDLARREHDRQRRLLDIASELGQLGGWAYELGAHTVNWSDEVQRLHGRPPGFRPTVDEALAHYAPHCREAMQQVLTGCAREGRPFDEIQQIDSTDGQRRWVRVVGRAVRDGAGAIVRIEGAIQDIGKRVVAEQALADSLAAWRRLAESMPLIVWSADADARVDYISPRLAEYAGVEPDSLLPDGWIALVHDDDRAVLTDIWRRTARSGAPYEIEFRLRAADGSWRWHLARAVRVSPGGRHAWYGTAIDIHDRRRLEQDARSALGRLRATLESMTDAVFALDREWRFTLLNAQAEKLLDRPRESLAGKVVWDEFPAAVGSRFQLEYERCMHDGEVVRFEEYYAPLSKTFDVTAYPAAQGITVYFRDVTEQRALSAQLQQMQRLESLGQLTGGVAHDFNNLLAVILGNAELLTEALPPGGPLEKLARMIAVAAERGAAMTKRLLAFARRQPLLPRPVDLNRLIDGMHDLLQRSLGEQIRIERVRGAGLWPTLVDAGQLETAVLNLAINARDAMPDGGRLTLETGNVALDESFAAAHADVAAGAYVMVAVSDTGSGIAPEHLPRLFEPFFTTKPKGKGTGLGLPTVYGFIKQSGGHVTVESELGRGTTVRLYLPRSNEPLPPETQVADEPPPPGRGEHVLLVEDEPTVRAHAHRLLGELGYRVTEAADGPQALALLERGLAVDLLFTDVVMPGGMSGRQLADAAHRLHPALPVLYTSGYTDGAIAADGRLDPGLLLLGKPYRRAELARMLRDALGRAAAGAAADTPD